MTKFRWFIIILFVVALVALFAAGQLFQLLPTPEVFFYGSLAVIVLLLIGYWFGTNKKDDNE